MPEKPMKVGEIAKTLGVDPNTVRNWCERYAAYLSDAAKPTDGGTRLFSSRDVSILTYIHSCLHSGLNHTEISMKMAERGSNADGEDIIVGMVEVMPTESPPTPQEGQGDALIVHVALTAMQEQINGIVRNQTTLLREATLRGALLGAIAALAFAAFVVWVFWLTGSG